MAKFVSRLGWVLNRLRDLSLDQGSKPTAQPVNADAHRAIAQPELTRRISLGLFGRLARQPRFRAARVVSRIRRRGNPKQKTARTQPLGSGGREFRPARGTKTGGC